MRTLELENYGVMEMSQHEEVNTDGGAVLISMLVLWGVGEINQAWREFTSGYETCKCHKKNEK